MVKQIKTVLIVQILIMLVLHVRHVHRVNTEQHVVTIVRLAAEVIIAVILLTVNVTMAVYLVNTVLTVILHAVLAVKVMKTSVIKLPDCVAVMISTMEMFVQLRVLIRARVKLVPMTRVTVLKVALLENMEMPVKMIVLMVVQQMDVHKFKHLVCVYLLIMEIYVIKNVL